MDGSLGPRHLERFLALVWQSGAIPVVVITKSDAASRQEVTGAVQQLEPLARGVQVVATSSRTGDGVPALKPYLRAGRTVALLGPSGAGKSTLANRLAGAEILRTATVRRDGGGRHTTTHRELILLPDGGLLIDTPGTRAMSVLGAGDGVDQAFVDIEVLAGACRFANCSHAGEESGCAVTAAVSAGRVQPGRLEAWLGLRGELRSSNAKDARSDVAERKRRKAAKFAARRASRT
jgi:ribosome biogenesis GTPase